MGEIRVPADRYRRAQTQRSPTNFKIGGEKMPVALSYWRAPAGIINDPQATLPWDELAGRRAATEKSAKKRRSPKMSETRTAP